MPKMKDGRAMHSGQDISAEKIPVELQLDPGHNPDCWPLQGPAGEEGPRCSGPDIDRDMGRAADNLASIQHPGSNQKRIIDRQQNCRRRSPRRLLIHLGSRQRTATETVTALAIIRRFRNRIRGASRDLRVVTTFTTGRHLLSGFIVRATAETAAQWTEHDHHG